MKLRLQRAPYEKLLKQIVYVEENMEGIAITAAEAKLFPTQKRARWYFESYIGEVESLFGNVEFVERAASPGDIYLNRLPFIVLDSRFTLIDRKKRVRFCRMTYDAFSENKDAADNIYFLSPAGRALLLKRAGQQVKAAIGGWLSEYTVGSIDIA